MKMIDDIDISALLREARSDDLVIKRLQIDRERQCRKLVADARDQRTKRLIDRGGLIVIAGLKGADKDVIFGALLRVKGEEADHGKLNVWQLRGQQKFAEWEQSGRNPTRPKFSSSGAGGSPVTAAKTWTRTFIEWGGVLEKAGLESWDAAEIPGALTVIAERLQDK